MRLLGEEEALEVDATTIAASTGYSAEETLDRLHFQQDVSVTARDLAETRGARGGFGDSGGPWFVGTSAYGLMHGQGVVPFVDLSTFSKVQNAEIAFGVVVETA